MHCDYCGCSECCGVDYQEDIILIKKYIKHEMEVLHRATQNFSKEPNNYDDEWLDGYNKGVASTLNNIQKEIEKIFPK